MPRRSPENVTPETPDGDPSRRRFQYSLRSLWVALTVVCVVLAIPGVMALALLVGVWLATAIVLIGGILVLQLPAWLILKSLARSDMIDPPRGQPFEGRANWPVSEPPTRTQEEADVP